MLNAKCVLCYVTYCWKDSFLAVKNKQKSLERIFFQASYCSKEKLNDEKGNRNATDSAKHYSRLFNTVFFYAKLQRFFHSYSISGSEIAHLSDPWQTFFTWFPKMLWLFLNFIVLGVLFWLAAFFQPLTLMTFIDHILLMATGIPCAKYEYQVFTGSEVWR